MRKEQNAVLAFMKLVGHTIKSEPSFSDQMDLSEALIQNEFDEYKRIKATIKHLQELYGGQAVLEYNFPYTLPLLADVADSLCDLLYVVLWACNSWGIDIEAVFDEVHASNMKKFVDGIKLAPNGKVMKPAGWKPPAVDSVIRSQIMRKIPLTEVLRESKSET